MDKFKLLDCTLRDGGYYNNWDFPEEVVSSYLSSVAEAGVNLVELGTRIFSSSSFKGAHAFTTEKYLNSLTLPAGPCYGVMVDAKTIISCEYGINDGVKRLFVPKTESKLDFVRVAAHFTELSEAVEICSKLKGMGYFVGLNLMQAVGRSAHALREAASQAEKSNAIDVLYFADSFGNMDEAEAESIIKKLREAWNGPLGIHAHDNTTKALSNTLYAAALGVTYLDSTVTGMGRGAGNVKTEYLTLELNNKFGCQYKPEALHEIVLQFFEPAQKQYGWGANLLYYIGAVKNIHPTYIQQLCGDKRFGFEEKVSAIRYLSEIESSRYDGENLEIALRRRKCSGERAVAEDISGLFKGREILLVGAGDTVKKYKKAIAQYVGSRKPVVVSVNINENLGYDVVDYYAISNNIRYLSDHEKYQSIVSKMIAPRSKLQEQIAPAINYELRIGDDWIIENDNCTLPLDLTTAYALAIAYAGGASSVSLVGFDGYPHLDERNKEVQEILDHFKKLVAIKCLTPTNYNVSTGSVYEI